MAILARDFARATSLIGTLPMESYSADPRSFALYRTCFWVTTHVVLCLVCGPHNFPSIEHALQGSPLYVEMGGMKSAIALNKILRRIQSTAQNSRFGSIKTSAQTKCVSPQMEKM